jgi:hypothetical protein
MSSNYKTEVPRRVRISSSDIRQDDFYIDDDIPKSDEGRDFTYGSIAELLGMD